MRKTEKINFNNFEEILKYLKNYTTNTYEEKDGFIFYKKSSTKLKKEFSLRIQHIKTFNKDCKNCKKYSLCKNLLFISEQRILTNILCNINAITSKDSFEHTEILNDKIEGLEFYFEQKEE